MGDIDDLVQRIDHLVRHGGINNDADVIGDFVEACFIRIDTTWFEAGQVAAVIPTGDNGDESCNVLLKSGVAIPLRIGPDEVMEFMKAAVARPQ